MDIKSELIKLFERARSQELACQAHIEHIERLHRIIDRFKERGGSAEYGRKTIDKLYKAEQQLNASIDALIDYRAAALQYIDKLEGEERAVIYRYYISGEKWQDIAVNTYMSERRLYLLRKSALAKLEKIYNEEVQTN